MTAAAEPKIVTALSASYWGEEKSCRERIVGEFLVDSTKLLSLLTCICGKITKG